jgi:ABC-type transporter Mla maintaining outer membrane lipid asymmetry ATPase subunit MlaF
VSSVNLNNPGSGASCEIELGRGLDYSVTARTPAELEALLEQLLQLPASQVADSVGSLINNINILQNIALPALYHGYAPVTEIEGEALDTFAECGVDGAQAEALFVKFPGELGPFDKRLAGFVRSMLARPEVLIYIRFFEGLTRTEMARAAALNSVFHKHRPDGTAVYLMLHDMPDLQPEGCLRSEL